MQTKDYLQKVVDYIEDHVKEVLTVDELASYCGFSRFYLHRLFSIYTGMSLIQYVRKRKLNYAMKALQSEQRILDIALEYGYASERAFSRAFVMEFGHSPSYFRNKQVIYSEKLTVNDLSLTIDVGDVMKFDFTKFKLDELNLLKREDVKKMLEYLSKVKYVTLDEMVVLSGTVCSENPEDEVIELMNSLAGEIGIEPVRSFGFDSPVEGDQSAEDYRGYEFWLAISKKDESKYDVYSEEKSEAGVLSYKGTTISKKVIPSYRYVSLRITDPMDKPFERIPTGWKVLVKWLEDNKIDLNAIGEDALVECLEEVIEVDGVQVMDIFIPIDRG